MKLCSKCNERPAVVFITRVEGDKSYPEGFCLKCAKELNIGPINDMLKSMNIPDEAMGELNESLSDVMSGIIDDETGEFNEEAINEKLDEFMPGGAATFPFFKIFSRRKIQICRQIRTALSMQSLSRKTLKKKENNLINQKNSSF